MNSHVIGSLLVLLAALANGARAQDEGQDDPKPTKYAVVQTGDELAVMEASLVDEHKKKVASDHAAATKAWQDAKAAAQKNKDKFADKKPAPAKVKVLVNNLESKEEADAVLQKLQAKVKKAAAKPARGEANEKDKQKNKDKDG